MYATESEFTTWYPNADQGTYDKYSFMAQKTIDNATSGIDGVKKLRVAFPTDEEDAETVKRCFCAIIMALDSIDKASAANGYVVTANGLQPRLIKSLSAGGESVTYADDVSDLAKAAATKAGKQSYIRGIIEEYLRATTDANGVNLLFGGSYPRGLLNV